MAISAKQAAKALTDSKGFVTAAAKNLGISRQQLHNIINKYPTVQEAVKDAREVELDFAEGILHSHMKEGRTAELLFFLKTQGASRGYQEVKPDKQQVEIIVKGYGEGDVSPDEL